MTAAGGKSGIPVGGTAGNTTANGGSRVATGTTSVGGTSNAGTCAPLPAACVAKAVTGNVLIDATHPANALQGVTQINGDLSVSILNGLDVSSLDCLQVVTGNVRFEPMSSGVAPILRNLSSVGGHVMFTTELTNNVNVSCSLSSLRSVSGSYTTGPALIVIGGFSGEVNLSKLTTCESIRLIDSQVTRLVLPSNVNLRFKELAVDSNALLSDLSGFENVLLSSVDNTDFMFSATVNPKLSTCRLLAIKKLFEAAGTTTASIYNDATDC